MYPNPLSKQYYKPTSWLNLEGFGHAFKAPIKSSYSDTSISSRDFTHQHINIRMKLQADITFLIPENIWKRCSLETIKVKIYIKTFLQHLLNNVEFFLCFNFSEISPRIYFWMVVYIDILYIKIFFIVIIIILEKYSLLRTFLICIDRNLYTFINWH